MDECVDYQARLLNAFLPAFDGHVVTGVAIGRGEEADSSALSLRALRAAAACRPERVASPASRNPWRGALVGCASGLAAIPRDLRLHSAPTVSRGSGWSGSQSGGRIIVESAQAMQSAGVIRIFSTESGFSPLATASFRMSAGQRT